MVHNQGPSSADGNHDSHYNKRHSLVELWEQYQKESKAEGHKPDYRHFELWLEATKKKRSRKQ